ncbi:2Fe-2S iron-sulfur cluster-binding protein [Candidatus Poriferisocius sp.]|uniref:2Fe-2S iron-sulfur cluster-binding protein n=1 Tax=Candidatus Poriferisocius sp. TaxID=3101276 RepID=UPI003B51FD6B
MKATKVSKPINLTIIYRGKRRSMDYVEGDTVLESARRAGLSPPFSCEAGNCATCMAFLAEGSVTMRANEALEPDEVDEGFILTCQSVPDCDAVIDYDSL